MKTAHASGGLRWQARPYISDSWACSITWVRAPTYPAAGPLVSLECPPLYIPGLPGRRASSVPQMPTPILYPAAGPPVPLGCASLYARQLGLQRPLGARFYPLGSPPPASGPCRPPAGSHLLLAMATSAYIEAGTQ